jgi:hypothetical protein
MVNGYMKLFCLFARCIAIILFGLTFAPASSMHSLTADSLTEVLTSAQPPGSDHLPSTFSFTINILSSLNTAALTSTLGVW